MLPTKCQPIKLISCFEKEIEDIELSVRCQMAQLQGPPMIGNDEIANISVMIMDQAINNNVILSGMSKEIPRV